MISARRARHISNIIIDPDIRNFINNELPDILKSLEKSIILETSNGGHVVKFDIGNLSKIHYDCVLKELQFYGYLLHGDGEPSFDVGW